MTTAESPIDVTDVVKFSRFHDAIFRDLSLDWTSGAATIGLILTGGDEATLRVHETMNLSCPRRKEWGFSMYILEGSVFKTPAGTEVIEMTIQSGDTIRIEGERISLTLSTKQNI